MIHIRRAGPADTRPMAGLLNEIIEIGGTTAYTEPVSPQFLVQKMEHAPSDSAWTVAEDDAGKLMGFQWIAPFVERPTEACDIATFVRAGATGLGIGSKLFDATVQAARDLGYAWINANIRSDNQGGLTYYQSRGFEDWKRVEGMRLANGETVAKIFKRYDLRD